MSVLHDICGRSRSPHEAVPALDNPPDLIAPSAKAGASTHPSLPIGPPLDSGLSASGKRRRLFAGGAIAALLSTARAASAAEPVPTAGNSPSGSAGSAPSPLPGSYNPTMDWKSPELRLVRRITLGLNVDEAARASSLGYEKYLELQLDPAAIDDSAVDAYVAKNFPTLTMTPAELLAIDSVMGQSGSVERELINATLYRSIYSKRQLYQRMVEFWTDHFNQDINKVGILKTPDDLNVIRANALGKFPDLLLASAHSASMMQYLDNVRSQKAHPNQNYARELMELQTLGVSGGYTQTDVVEVARCLTGWGFVGDKTKPEYGMFAFNPNNHDRGAKILNLGLPAPIRIPENKKGETGENDGDILLAALASHPSTAAFIAAKLSKWLLRYDPPQTLISAVAEEYMDTGGDIKAMIRIILKKSNLAAAPAKYKRPYHLAVSAVRATGALVTDFGALRSALSRMGHLPFNWAPPNGYPDDINFWAGLILPRWDFASQFAGTAAAKGGPDVSSLVTLKTPEKIVAAINTALYAGEMPAAEQKDLIAYLTPPPPVKPTTKPPEPVSEARIREGLGLAISSLSYQYY